MEHAAVINNDPKKHIKGQGGSVEPLPPPIAERSSMITVEFEPTREGRKTENARFPRLHRNLVTKKNPASFALGQAAASNKRGSAKGGGGFSASRGGRSGGEHRRARTNPKRRHETTATEGRRTKDDLVHHPAKLDRQREVRRGISTMRVRGSYCQAAGQPAQRKSAASTPPQIKILLSQMGFSGNRPRSTATNYCIT